MSDADTEKKLCQNSSNAAVNAGSVDCQAGPQSNKLGLVAFYVDAGASNRPTWPNEKHTGGTGKGPENVAKNIVALTKDEKAVTLGQVGYGLCNSNMGFENKIAGLMIPYRVLTFAVR